MDVSPIEMQLTYAVNQRSNPLYAAILISIMAIGGIFYFNPAIGFLTSMVFLASVAVRNFRSYGAERFTQSSVLFGGSTEKKFKAWLSLFIALGAVIIIFSAIVFGAGYLGERATGKDPTKGLPIFGDWGQWFKQQVGLESTPVPSGQTTIQGPSGTTTIVQSPFPTAVGPRNALLRFTPVHAWDKTTITSGNEFLVVIKDKNYLTSYDVIGDVTAANTVGNQQLSTGDNLELVLSSDAVPTGGEDYIMRWFTVNYLQEGEPIKDKRTGDTIGSVKFSTGDTQYWELGSLPLYPRSTLANTDVAIGLTSTIREITDGTSTVANANTLTSSQQATMATNSDDFFITISLGATGLAYGIPFYTLSGDSTPQLQLRVAMVALSFNNVSVKLDGGGWTQAAAPSTSWTTWIRQVDPIIGTSTTRGRLQITAKFDTGALAASTQFEVLLHGPSDGQLETHWKTATSISTAATGYGALSASNTISPDDINYSTGISYSGGVPADAVLATRLQSPA